MLIAYIAYASSPHYSRAVGRTCIATNGGRRGSDCLYAQLIPGQAAHPLPPVSPSASYRTPFSAAPAARDIDSDLGYPTNFAEVFALGHELGSGSFGTVYSAVDRESGESVAVKVRASTTLCCPTCQTHGIRNTAVPLQSEMSTVSQSRNPLYWRLILLQSSGKFDLFRQSYTSIECRSCPKTIPVAAHETDEAVAGPGETSSSTKSRKSSMCLRGGPSACFCLSGCEGGCVEQSIQQSMSLQFDCLWPRVLRLSVAIQVASQWQGD